MASEKILLYLQNCNNQLLCEELDKLSDSQIEELLRNEANEFNKSFLKIIEAVVIGLKNKDRLSHIILYVFKCIFKILRSVKECLHINEYNQYLMREMVVLKPDDYVELCLLMIDAIVDQETKNYSWLLLLSKAFSLSVQYPRLNSDRSLQCADGTKFKTEMISKLCGIEWQNEFTTTFAKVISDANFNASDSEQILLKFFEQFEVLDLHDLPYFMNDLIKFSTNVKQTKQILTAVFSFFKDKQECINASHEGNVSEVMNKFQLSECQGVLLVSIKKNPWQNIKLNKPVLALLKAAKESLLEVSLTSFLFGLSFVLASDTRFKDEIYVLLRQLIFKNFQVKHQLIAENWLKFCILPRINIKSLFSQVVENTKLKDWSIIQNGIIEFCFILLDYYGFKINALMKTFPREIKKVPSPQQDVLDLSVSILASLFKINDQCQQRILHKILFLIQTNKTTVSYQYISLLKVMVKTYPQFLTRNLSELRITVEDINSMHPNNSMKLIASLMPFVRSNHSFRDILMLSLRKALSSKSTNSQISGIYGFLNFLRCFPLQDSVTYSQLSSQSSQSVFSIATQSSSDLLSYNKGRPVNSEFLCLEIMQILRRCLQQKCEIRCEFYSGVSWVSSKNIKLIPFVVDVLMKQFKKYFESEEDTIPPIKLEECIAKTPSLESEICLLEPLPVLLSSLQTCFYLVMKRKSSSADSYEILDESVENEITSLFTSLIRRMKKCELDDFQMDKELDFSSNTSKGRKHFMILTTLIGIYQVLMQYNFLQNSSSDNEAEDQLDLLVSYLNFYEIFKVQKNRHFSGQPSWQLTSVSIIYLSTMIETLFLKNDKTQEIFVNVLKESKSFLKYCWTTVHFALSFVCENGYYPGATGFDKSQLFLHVCNIAKVSLHYFMIERNNFTNYDVVWLALETYLFAFQYIYQWRRENLNEFLISFSDQEVNSNNKNEIINSLILRFQRIIIGFVEQENLTANHRKVISTSSSILDILTKIYLHFEEKSDDLLNESFEWWQQLCSAKNNDVGCCKIFLSSFLHSTSSSSTEIGLETVLRDLCADVRYQMGSIDEDANSAKKTFYNIITEASSPHLMPIICKYVDSYYSSMDWMLQQIKGQSLYSEVEDKSDVICIKVLKVSQGLLEMIQTLVTETSTIELILKTSTSAFNIITSLTKFFLWKRNQTGENISTKFDKLIRFVGIELLKPVYGFIIHAESTQTESLDLSRSNSGGKKTESKTFNLRKAKVLRQSKGVASLIYSIEQHEHQLILLGKKLKINLMRSHHLTTSRDFRIRSEVLDKALNEEQSEKSLSDDEVNEAKRAKMDEE